MIKQVCTGSCHADEVPYSWNMCTAISIPANKKLDVSLSEEIKLKKKKKWLNEFLIDWNYLPAIFFL